MRIREKHSITRGFSAALALLFAFFSIPASCDTFEYEFPAGWSMISFPFTPSASNTLEMFGEELPDTIYSFDNSGYTHIGETSGVQPGKSYWIYYEVPTWVALDGTPVQSETLDQTLTAGWNMISYPYNMDTTVDAFAIGSQPAMNSITFYAYNPSDGSYSTTTTINAWSSFWVYAEESKTLTTYNPSPTENNVVLSGDSYAAVYTPLPFTGEYTPRPPAGIQPEVIPFSGLADCWATNSLVVPMEDTAYNFLLDATDTLQLPGAGYTIAFEAERLANVEGGYSSAFIWNLKCASCDQEKQDWTFHDSNFTKISYLDDKYGVTCTVPEFDSFVVVIDKRPKPELNLHCGDGMVYMEWYSLDEDMPDAKSDIYGCNRTSCSSILKEVPYGFTSEYSAENGTETCFAVSGAGLLEPTQRSKVSDIKCITPSADSETCPINPITLLGPGDVSTLDQLPEYSFTGSGDIEYYRIRVYETGGSLVLLKTNIEGEGEGVLERGNFNAGFLYDDYDQYGDPPGLKRGHEYYWYIEGTRSSSNIPITSQTFSFIYNGEECEEIIEAPECVYPSDWETVGSLEPVFTWQEVEGADEYMVSVYDDSMLLVGSMETVAGNSAQYSGEPLVNGSTYSWTVTALNSCSDPATGTAFTFTSTEIATASLPVPQWATSGPGPLTGGDRLVSLNWNEIEDSEVQGYAVYREQDPGGFSVEDFIDIISKGQLGGENPDPDCPVVFSQSNPGYCDIGATNGETYYYGVASVGTGVAIGEMATGSITLDLMSPVLITPGGGVVEIASDTPFFSWYPVNGNDVGYLLTLEDEISGTTIWQPTTADTSVIYSGSPALEEGKSYTWTVEAFNGNGVHSDSSEALRFVKVGSSTTMGWVYFCEGMQCAPQQSAPYDISYSNSAITLYWEKPDEENITGFNIYRCKDQPGLCTGEENLATTTANVECSLLKYNVVCYEDAGLARGSTYYYNITMINSEETESAPSETMDATLVLKGPLPSSPVYDSTVYSPEPVFTWYGENGASQYEFQIIKAPDTFIVPDNYIWQYTVSDPTEATESVSITFNRDDLMAEALQNRADPDMPGNQYYWRVCSSNDRFPNLACSNSSQFYKKMTPPQTVSPQSGTIFSSPTITFEWTTSEGAAGYTLRLCERQSINFDCDSEPIHHQADIPGGDTTEYTMEGVLLNWCDTATDPSCYEGGTYIWEIRAYDKYGETSGYWEYQDRELIYNLFQVLNSPEDYTELHADPACATSTDYFGSDTFIYETSFSWVDFSATGTYSFKMTDVDSATVIYEDVVTGNSLQANTDCATSGAAIPFSINTNYAWTVTYEGDSYNDDMVYNLHTNFPAPTLVSPADGASIARATDCDGLSSTFCATFTWDGGAGIPLTGSYDIELLVNGSLFFLCEQAFIYDSFNPPYPEFSNYFTAECDFSTAELFPGDTISWRVRARDDSGEITESGFGNPGNWSDPFTLNVIAP